MYFKGQKLNCSAEKWLLQLIIIYDSIKINAMKHLCEPVSPVVTNPGIQMVTI